jgi:hypothetical protein
MASLMEKGTHTLNEFLASLLLFLDLKKAVVISKPEQLFVSNLGWYWSNK